MMTPAKQPATMSLATWLTTTFILSSAYVYIHTIERERVRESKERGREEGRKGGRERGREGGREGGLEGASSTLHLSDDVSIHTMYINNRERDRKRGSPGSQREGRSAFEFNLLLKSRLRIP
jgi:hypothetical protein